MNIIECHNGIAAGPLSDILKMGDEGAAYWAKGFKQDLSSHSFNSCVGVVLYGDLSGYGAVIHLWNPAGVNEVREIVDRYMGWLMEKTGGYCGDDVQAFVFGGQQLVDNPKSKAAREITLPRIQGIREFLEGRWDMRVIVADKGSETVEVNLKTPFGQIENLVKLQRGYASSSPHEMSQSPKSTMRGRSGSGDFSSSGKNRPKFDHL